MKESGIPYLMYHELEVSGRALLETEPGYVHYVVTQEDFSAQLSRMRSAGLHGISVTEALARRNRQDVVCITFDDGSETDLLAAAPLLMEVGFSATFYLVAGFLDQPGYLSVAQVRELSDLGFEIGSHSMTHSFLPNLDDKSLRTEIFDSKDCLEQLTGSRIDHFSCPGGRWEARVSELAKGAGYASVVTSEIGTNSEMTDPYRLKRLAVFRETSPEDFIELCIGQNLLTRRVRNSMLTIAKEMFGDARYDRIRSGLLRNRKIPEDTPRNT
jgi:peptidoglycan/xylan/chitin deacetylase (PgdA/CDA1 family)